MRKPLVFPRGIDWEYWNKIDSIYLMNATTFSQIYSKYIANVGYF